MGLQNLLMVNEIVMPVVGFDGYFVSSFGRVFSNRPRNGKGLKNGEFRELTQLKCSGGRYLQFGATGKKILTHRAVMEAFIGPCNKWEEVSHKDGNSHNNRLFNLEYTSHKNNERLKVLHGTSPSGERNANAKLKKSDVSEIRNRVKTEGRGAGARLSKEFGVSEATISNIANGKRWK